jgi:hypothetical protein
MNNSKDDAPKVRTIENHHHHQILGSFKPEDAVARR